MPTCFSKWKPFFFPRSSQAKNQHPVAVMSTTRPAPAAVHNRNDIRVINFPGATKFEPASEAESYRKLTLSGSSLKGAWTDNQNHFEADEVSEVLHCKHVSGLQIGGVVPVVPEGRWEVSILLKSPSFSHFSKTIDWYVTVEDAESGANSDPSALLHLKTGDHAEDSFEFGASMEWMRCCMGTITVTKPNHQVRLSIQGFRGYSIDNFSFGGLELKPYRIGWKKEALLLRMLNNAGDDENNNATGGLSSIFDLPKDVVVRIAQYLITPLPKETLLMQKY